MFALFGELFSYSFLVRALIVGSLVALCAALLGVSLVLKRYSMIGDGLSHVGFGALSIAMAMNAAPLAVAIPVVIVAAFLLLRISQNSRLGGDSAIGADFLRSACGRRACNLAHKRAQRGCLQLYVRQHPCHERRGRLSFSRPCRCGPRAFHCVL